MWSRLIAVGLLTAALSGAPPQPLPTFNPTLFQELRWRPIGPQRASRTKAASGVPTKPFTFYVGVVNGGDWKTDDAGRTWNPIFDDQPTGSIGAIAVAESDPNLEGRGCGKDRHGGGDDEQALQHLHDLLESTIPAAPRWPAPPSREGVAGDSVRLAGPGVDSAFWGDLRLSDELVLNSL